MTLVVDFFEFIEINGQIIPQGDRRSIVLHKLTPHEEDDVVMKEVKEKISEQTDIPINRIKVIGWSGL
ncbi:hypothetical protein [Radiobacillus deserti]|uniref:Uncharacterized protein n=1 Tax=Radiobacillus deserti TaxID=2594883 RepID=A0A516KFX6_9BACI|nr:hypothetical protein [Radiobacillus deserti]QDP40276.1 hypothetical protein FN924_08875 [Radiobacillus deserti]